MEDAHIQMMLPDLLDPDTTEESKQRILESLIKLIQKANYQAIEQDIAKALEQIKSARAKGDEQPHQAAADRYEELLLQCGSPYFVRTKVAEMVLSKVTTAVIEMVRQGFHRMGKGDLLLEIEASINDQPRQISDYLHEQSTLDPVADQSSSMVS